MSFPFELESETSINEEKYKEPCEYGIDFSTGQLTGRKVYGLDAIRVWIWTALYTPRYRYLIYTWDYGNELDSLIGKGYSQEYIDLEASRMIEECLMLNSNISGVSDFDFILNSDKLRGIFTVNTTYGEVRMSV